GRSPTSGPTPDVSCAAPSPANAGIIGTDSQTFTFTCRAISGNGYVSFTANATGHYVNAAADVLATATAVSSPAPSPSKTVPNVIVDTVKPTLEFAAATPLANQYGWN